MNRRANTATTAPARIRGCAPEAQSWARGGGAITKGKLDFGPWEQIFYGEFDGNRRKRVLVKIIASKQTANLRSSSLIMDSSPAAERISGD